MKRLFIILFLLTTIFQTFSVAQANIADDTNPSPRYEGMIKNIKIPPSSFLYYIVSGDKEIVQKLLDEGANPDFSYGRIPATFFAAYYKQYEILELLLNAGADINKKVFGITLLDFCVYTLNSEGVKTAINHKADFKKESIGVEYLGYAIKKNNPELIKILLDEGIKPDRYCIRQTKKLDDENLRNLIIQKGEQK